MMTTRIFTVILVGTSAVSWAQPKQETQPKKEESGAERVTYVDDEGETKRATANRDSLWIEIADPTPAKHGTEFVVLDEDAGPISQLRLDASKGTTIVKRVRVFFADGTEKTIKLNRKLVRKSRNNMLIVDLGMPKVIHRVVVTTDATTNGAYAIYGTAGGGIVVTR